MWRGIAPTGGACLLAAFTFLMHRNASGLASMLAWFSSLTRKYGPCTLPGFGLPSCRFTGADLYALCSDAWMTALKGAIARQEQQEKERQRGQQDGEPAGSSAAATAGTSAARDDSGEGEEVVVTHASFLEAVEALQPSLSAEEVAKYERIRDQYNSQQAR